VGAGWSEGMLYRCGKWVRMVYAHGERVLWLNRGYRCEMALVPVAVDDIIHEQWAAVLVGSMARGRHVVVRGGPRRWTSVAVMPLQNSCGARWISHSVWASSILIIDPVDALLPLLLTDIS
jgi:hypothetical protein